MMERDGWDASAQLPEQVYWWNCQKKCRADQASIVIATLCDERDHERARETAVVISEYGLRRHLTVRRDDDRVEMRLMARRHMGEKERQITRVEIRNLMREAKKETTV